MTCPGCFQPKSDTPVCPQCGYDESLRRSPLVLPHHTPLNAGRYRVGRVLGKPGGFGITYLGWDERLRTPVAIKEYLPRDLAGRDTDHWTVAAHSGEDAEHFAYGLGKFLEEARTLAQLDHPNLVRVRDFFEEHGTAYLVMDYYDGLTLAEYLTRQPGGKLPEEQAIGILLPILDGLREVHAKGFLHRDIKPANIYLTAGNRPILLDFGAARQAMGEHSRSLSVVLSEGYAPLEQYQRNGRQGPWTDVYGAAATLYTMVTGRVPPSATDRLGADNLPGLLDLSPRLLLTIRFGMDQDQSRRAASIGQWQRILLGEGEAADAGKTAGPKPPPRENPPAWAAQGAVENGARRKALAVIAIALMVIAVWAYQTGTRKPQPETGGAGNPVTAIPAEPQTAAPPAPPAPEQPPASPTAGQEARVPSQPAGQAASTTNERSEERQPTLSDQRPINLPKKFKSIDLAQYLRDFGYPHQPSIRFYNERTLKKYEQAECVKDIKNGAECSTEVESECTEFILECGQRYIDFNITLWDKAKGRLSAIKKDGGLHIISTASETIIKASKMDHSIGDYAGETEVDMTFPRDKIKEPLQNIINLDDVIYFKIGNEAFGLQNSSQLKKSLSRFLKDCRMD